MKRNLLIIGLIVLVIGVAVFLFLKNRFQADETSGPAIFSLSKDVANYTWPDINGFDDWQKDKIIVRANQSEAGGEVTSALSLPRKVELGIKYEAVKVAGDIAQNYRGSDITSGGSPEFPLNEAALVKLRYCQANPTQICSFGFYKAGGTGVTTVTKVSLNFAGQTLDASEITDFWHQQQGDLYGSSGHSFIRVGHDDFANIDYQSYADFKNLSTIPIGKLDGSSPVTLTTSGQGGSVLVGLSVQKNALTAGKATFDAITVAPSLDTLANTSGKVKILLDSGSPDTAWKALNFETLEPLQTGELIKKRICISNDINDPFTCAMDLAVKPKGRYAAVEISLSATNVAHGPQIKSITIDKAIDTSVVNVAATAVPLSGGVLGGTVSPTSVDIVRGGSVTISSKANTGYMINKIAIAPKVPVAGVNGCLVPGLSQSSYQGRTEYSFPLVAYTDCNVRVAFAVKKNLVSVGFALDQSLQTKFDEYMMNMIRDSVTSNIMKELGISDYRQKIVQQADQYLLTHNIGREVWPAMPSAPGWQECVDNNSLCKYYLGSLASDYLTQTITTDLNGVVSTLAAKATASPYGRSNPVIDLVVDNGSSQIFTILPNRVVGYYIKDDITLSGQGSLSCQYTNASVVGTPVRTQAVCTVTNIKSDVSLNVTIMTRLTFANISTSVRAQIKKDFTNVLAGQPLKDLWNTVVSQAASQ